MVVALVTRRAFLLAPMLGMVAPRSGEASGLHVQGTLAANDQGDEGYYALCADNGTCHPIDAVGIVVHPKNLLADDLRALAGKRVQFSLFSL